MLLVAATPPPSPAQPAQTTDRAYGLIGTWSCESFAHSRGTMTFTRNADGSISMKNLFTTIDGRSGAFDEQYRFDPAMARWSWTAAIPGVATFEERGSAGEWTADEWTFDGVVRTSSPASPDSIAGPKLSSQALRMTYTDLGGAAFRRGFEVFRNGTWVPASTSTCKREAE
jgi:hypothetical protein